MYLAQLPGKLPSQLEEREDILTCNVFSFCKYSDRTVFLERYLDRLLGLTLAPGDAEKAEFHFWPRNDDNT